MVVFILKQRQGYHASNLLIIYVQPWASQFVVYFFEIILYKERIHPTRSAEAGRNTKSISFKA